MAARSACKIPGFMRATAFQRWLHRLALAATFALVLVPTFGRLAQAGQGDALRDAWGAMCTVAGLTLDGDDAHGRTHDPAPRVPHAPHQGNGDCDYCPLLQALVAPKPPVLQAIAVVPAPAPAFAADLATPCFRHPTGLGSRGPPIAA
jgi:hypothetical protein